MTDRREPELSRTDAEHLLAGGAADRPRLESLLVAAVRDMGEVDPARARGAMAAFRAARGPAAAPRRTGRRAAWVAALSGKVVIGTAVAATAVTGTFAVTIGGVGLDGGPPREPVPSQPADLSSDPGVTPGPEQWPTLPSVATTPPVDTPPRDGLVTPGRPTDLPTGAPTEVPSGPGTRGVPPTDRPSRGPSTLPGQTTQPPSAQPTQRPTQRSSRTPESASVTSGLGGRS